MAVWKATIRQRAWPAALTIEPASAISWHAWINPYTNPFPFSEYP